MNTTTPAVKAAKTAITPTRAEDYATWYQQVIRGADMAEMSGVRGAMIIKPWGFGIWELLRDELDRRIKAGGHENCYFPLFIPLSLLAKEAEHVEGFAKEMAVVTHHRLVAKNGTLVPDGELEEPLVVRPTSETVIGEAFAKWVKSYRDLPVLINQWANVVRWELRPRIFMRTTEFLWQEGHTAHASQEDAEKEVKWALDMYQETVESVMAMPVIPGEKSAGERFPGAVKTFCIEAMMQDGKALQAGTSHYLGQNFAKAANIQYQTKEGTVDFAHTTSWGVSTRLIGGLIMTHADDNGLRLPPRIAPQQVVIVPVLRADADNDAVLAYAEQVAAKLRGLTFGGLPVRAKVDTRDIASADKRWQWVKKGVPLICEIGPRDMEKNAVAVARRDKLQDPKRFLGVDEFVSLVPAELAAIHDNLYAEAKAVVAARTRTDIKTWEDFKAYFSNSGDESFNKGQGFVRAKWCGDVETEAMIKELGVTIRCLPFDQDGQEGTCVITGKPATIDAIFARSY